MLMTEQDYADIGLPKVSCVPLPSRSVYHSLNDCILLFIPDYVEFIGAEGEINGQYEKVTHVHWITTQPSDERPNAAASSIGPSNEASSTAATTVELYDVPGSRSSQCIASTGY